MEAYTQLLYYLKTLGDADDYINTVTKDGDDLDLDKGIVYPLLDISINTGSFPSTALVRFNVQLSCLQVRDINNEITSDKFWDQDNEVDNHNETFASLYRIWVILARNFEELNITASEAPTIDKITYSGKNLLDGWALTFDVDLPYTNVNLC